MNPYVFKADRVNGSQCLACECNISGSESIGCDLNGTCTCKENVTGNKCEFCTTGYFPFPVCNKGSIEQPCKMSNIL